MSIDKWLSKEKSEDIEKKPQKNYSNEKIQEVKERKISELIGKQHKTSKKKAKNEIHNENDDFLS